VKINLKFRILNFKPLLLTILSRLKRRALTVKQISTASDDIPFSTSEDVDSEPIPFSLNAAIPRAIIINRQLGQYSRQVNIWIVTANIFVNIDHPGS